MTRYRPAHECQYEYSDRTRRSGCTWTVAAMGVDAQSAGVQDPTPDAVMARVARIEETNPASPGWSLPDAALAMQRMGVPFAVRAGQGWSAVRAARASGCYLLLQGDSDRFPDGSCSGTFDGDHAIGVHPDSAPDGRWLIDDPICTGPTLQPEERLRAYAERFMPSVAFGVFTRPVQLLEDPMATIYSDPRVRSAVWPKGSAIYDGPTGPASGRVTGGTARYVICGRDRPAEPTRYLVDGADANPSAPMAWLAAAGATSFQDESYNAGVDAATKAAAAARR